MTPNYVAFAVPFFFVCIGIELLAARRRGLGAYRFADAVTDLGCGISSELAKLFLHGVLFAGYLFVFNYRILESSSHSPWIWLFAIIAVDFIYYWWHRLSHEVNFLWAAHVVHHTSEDYNLAVALRQSITTHFTAIPFYLPLALLGVPPVVYITVQSFNTLYQFWIHTELAGKLGPLEWVLNTPSHHRVHHAINPRYLDKNYAGFLIVWDRLFGTFIEETEAPVYGTVKPLASFNPFIAQFHYWADLARASARAPYFADKLLVWVKSPAWHPRGLPAYPSSEGVTRDNRPKYDPKVGRGAITYVAIWFGAAILLTTAMMFFQSSWPLALLGAGSTLVVMTLLSAGAICEQKSWAKPFEAFRLASVAVLGIALVLR